METDAQLKRDIVAELPLGPSEDPVKVRTRSGWIALSGSLEWDYQHRRAKEAARDPMECDRWDEITVKPTAS